MRYLIARVEEGTPIEQLRRLGEHRVIDSLAEELDADTAKAAALLTGQEPWNSATFEVVRIPLADAERLVIEGRRSAEITARVGPV